MEGLSPEERLEILLQGPSRHAAAGGGVGAPAIAQAPAPRLPVALPLPVEGEESEFSTDPYSFGAGALGPPAPPAGVWERVLSPLSWVIDALCLLRRGSRERAFALLSELPFSRRAPPRAVYNKRTGRLTAVNIPRGEEAKARLRLPALPPPHSPRSRRPHDASLTPLSPRCGAG